MCNEPDLLRVKWDDWLKSGTGKVSRGFYQFDKYLMREGKGRQTLLTSIQWQKKMHWAKTKIQEILFKPKKKLSVWEQSNIRTSCPDRLWSLYSWRNSKSNWKQPWATQSSSACFEQAVVFKKHLNWPKWQTAPSFFQNIL